MQTLSHELIIIDSSSTDDTLTLVKPYAKHIVSIPQNEFDHGGTRTKAAKLATGEIIIFLTQDALPYDKYTLENIVLAFKQDAVAAAYGKQLPYETSNVFGKHLRVFNYLDSSSTKSLKDKDKYGIKTAFLSDSFAAYRRTVLKEVEWFKDGLILGEDTYLGSKILLADYSIAYVSEAKVYHSHSYTIWEEFKRYFDIGVFHEQENWILQTFGKIEGEGSRYVKSELAYLIKQEKYQDIPASFMRNGCKYLAYKLGRNHKSLPGFLIKKFSMHAQWWDK